MNAEMIAGALTIALVYGLILFSYYQAVGGWPGRKKLAMIPSTHSNQYLTTRKRLRQRLRARIRSKNEY
jgi:hypothetical protein